MFLYQFRNHINVLEERRLIHFSPEVFSPRNHESDESEHPNDRPQSKKRQQRVFGEIYRSKRQEQRDHKTEVEQANHKLAEYSEDQKSMEEASRQAVFQKGKSFLDKFCGESERGIWEYSTGWSINRSAQISFVAGMWKVRLKAVWKNEKWEDPSLRASGDGAVRKIFSHLANMNKQIKGKEYSKQWLGKEGNEKPHVSRLQYEKFPIALNTTHASLTIIEGPEVELWFQDSGYFCAEINPSNWKEEYWGQNSHTIGGGQMVGVDNKRYLRLKPNQTEAMFAIWPSNWRGWTKEEREIYGPLCFVKLENKGN